MTLRMEAGARGKTYKIGQAAKLLDVKPFVLRFWESEFKDVLVPVRTPSGQRAYTQGNVELVREIKRLLYDEGLTIEGAKKRLHQGVTLPGAQPTTQPTTQAGTQAGAQAAPAQAAPAQAAPPQHFEAQPALPGLARAEQVAAAQVATAQAEARRAAAQLAAAQEAAAQASASAAAHITTATQAAARATARADALALVLSDLQQELKAIRDLLG